MSGPKCYHYVVAEDPAVVAAREEAAALGAARGRAEAAVGRLRRLHDEAGGLHERHGGSITNIDLPISPAASTSAEMRVEADRLERQAAEAETRFRREVGEARKASFVAQLAGNAAGSTPHAAGLDRLLAAAAARAERAAPEAEGEAPDGRTAFADECARIFDRLRPDAPTSAREEVERTLEVALSTSGEERAPLLVDRLRSAVQSANAAAAERDRRSRQVDALLGGLGNLDEPQAVRLREMLLEEREAGRSVEVLVAEVERARQAAKAREEAAQREQKRARVADALEESFRELGYDVQPGFETALAANGSGLARRAGWKDHAVRVLLDPSTDELRLHVVRDDKPQFVGAENVAREKELCVDRPELERALAARGVDLDPRELIEPGVVPLAVVPLTRVGFPRRRGVAAPAARERAQE